MYPYNMSQWVILFTWYCFVGWIWESCYVSIVEGLKRKHWKWVNRGFLHGPFLPIYGSAAVVILVAAIPVKDNLWMVYVAGALAATFLELITGSIMERLFKVKYWDYSELPLNFHGYICFFVSLFWGACAVLMIRVIHVPVERVLFLLPDTITDIMAVVMVAYFTYDFTISFREAMDLREVLERLTESNESLQRLERRFDAFVAFTPLSDTAEWKEKGRTAKERVLERLEHKREESVTRIRKMREYLLGPESVSSLDKKELLEQLDQLLKNIFSRSNRQLLHIAKHLRRNPGVLSRKYQKALEEIKDLINKS